MSKMLFVLIFQTEMAGIKRYKERKPENIIAKQ